MTIRGRFCESVTKVSYLAAVGLAITACGKVGQQSFYQFEPNNSSIDISDSGGANDGGAAGGSTSGGSSGGAGTTSGGTTTGAAGSTSSSSTSSTSTSSSSTSSTSTSSTSSSSSTSGNGNGNGGGTTTGTSSTTSGSSTTTGGAAGTTGSAGTTGAAGATGSTGSGGSGGTPTPKVVTCGDGEVEALVDFKCHTSASNAGSAVHCVFQDKGGPMDGALALWFNPVSQAAAGCVAVSQDSIFAKLGHLPSTTGQYHFSGTLKACLPKGGTHDEMRSAAIMEFMGDLASNPMDGHVANHSPARKGNGSVSLDSLSGTPLSAGVCPRSE